MPQHADTTVPPRRRSEIVDNTEDEESPELSSDEWALGSRIICPANELLERSAV